MKLKDIENILHGNTQFELQYEDDYTGTLYWNEEAQVWAYDEETFTDEQLKELTVVEISPDWTQLRVVLKK